LESGQRTFYTLEAMRGVAPGTVAWALYRTGEKRPVETGVTDISRLGPAGWVALRTVGPQLVALTAWAPSRPGSVLLASHAFPDTQLALVSAPPPVKQGVKVRRLVAKTKTAPKG
jgi:hypothetical protein